ncbi:hypothetical protein NMY22_g2240 [Coprinellus aureogranulatus]|nr:hypothetical protein NMY22_g2240 [Coprinellus aureogranulatus]
MPLSAEHMPSEPVLVHREQAKVGERKLDGICSYVSNMAASICFAPWRSICDRRLVASAMSTMLFEVRHQFQQEIKTLRMVRPQTEASQSRVSAAEGYTLMADPSLQHSTFRAPAEVKGTTAVRLRRPELMSNNGQLTSFMSVALTDGQARCGLQQELSLDAAVWKAHSDGRDTQIPDPLNLHDRRPLNIWQPPAFTLHKWWSLGDNELQIRR